MSVVALVTAFLVLVTGHPVAWSVVGFLFAAAPLAGLLLALGVGFRGAVAAGPGWIGVRVLRHWRVVDLGEVRTVHLGFDDPLGGFGPFRAGRFGPFALPGGGGSAGSSNPELDPGPAGPEGPARAGPGRALVLEDAAGRRIELEPDALESGLADVVRRGLGPNAEITPDAARALGEDRGESPRTGPSEEANSPESGDTRGTQDTRDIGDAP